MTTLNPRDWWDPSGGFESPNRNRPEDLNREVTSRWTMATALCVWIASLAPPHLFLSALAGLLFLAGLASMDWPLCKDTIRWQSISPPGTRLRGH